VLPHPKIVIAAPDRHRLLAAIILAPYCMWKMTATTFDIDKRAVPSLLMKAFQR
jgi:multisubunit Na+/H+ antiporter MnhE subunit